MGKHNFFLRKSKFLRENLEKLRKSQVFPNITQSFERKHKNIFSEENLELQRKKAEKLAAAAAAKEEDEKEDLGASKGPRARAVELVAHEEQQHKLLPEPVCHNYFGRSHPDASSWLCGQPVWFLRAMPR